VDDLERDVHVMVVGDVREVVVVVADEPVVAVDDAAVAGVVVVVAMEAKIKSSD
jgi:hypothetical protein